MGQSRTEDLLENILGSDNDIVPPKSRVEAILYNTLGYECIIEPPKSRIEELLLRVLEYLNSLVSISVTLSKDEYIKGENINYDDAIIIATFETGKTAIISPESLVWSPSNNTLLDSVGSQSVTASYSIGDVTKTWSGEINVDYPISRIEVTTPPVKTEYNEGDTIDFTGIEVTAYKENDDVWGVVPFNELEFPVTIVSID